MFCQFSNMKQFFIWFLSKPLKKCVFYKIWFSIKYQHVRPDSQAPIHYLSFQSVIAIQPPVSLVFCHELPLTSIDAQPCSSPLSIIVLCHKLVISSTTAHCWIKILSSIIAWRQFLLSVPITKRVHSLPWPEYVSVSICFHFCSIRQNTFKRVNFVRFFFTAD